MSTNQRGETADEVVARSMQRPAKEARMTKSDKLFEPVLDNNEHNAACNLTVGDKRPPTRPAVTSVANSTRLPRSAAMRNIDNRGCYFGSDCPVMGARSVRKAHHILTGDEYVAAL